MITLNDATERNHLDDQVLLIQQLNEVNERRRMDERESRYVNHSSNIIAQSNIIPNEDINMDLAINPNTNMDIDDGSSQQTELDNQPFTFHPPVNRQLFVDMEYTVTPVRNNPVERSKVIARSKLEEFCPTECSICQETPKYKDAVYTECSHYYCKGCWQSWMNTDGSNKKCPTCRKDMPIITTFKARAPNRRNVV